MNRNKITPGKKNKSSGKILNLPSPAQVKEISRKYSQSSIISKAFQATERKSVFVDHTEIPAAYNKTWLGLMVKDPHWLFATWEIAPSDIVALRSKISDPDYQAKITLRMYDITRIDFNGTNAHSYFDLDVGAASNWHFNLWSDDVSFCGEIGLKMPSGEFYPLTRSQCVQTPRASTSWRSDQIWMEIKDEAQETPFVISPVHDNTPFNGNSQQFQKKNGRKIYLSWEDIRRYYSNLMPRLREIIAARLTALYGKTAYRYKLAGESLKDKKGIWALMPGKRIKIGASEEMVLIGGSENWMGSASLQLQMKQRKFFFELGAELIVYGRTEPDAEVWQGKKKVNLRHDGTFSLRYALPDGKVHLPFDAIPRDKLEKRNITMTVTRQTTESSQNFEGEKI